MFYLLCGTTLCLVLTVLPLVMFPDVARRIGKIWIQWGPRKPKGVEILAYFVAVMVILWLFLAMALIGDIIRDSGLYPTARVVFGFLGFGNIGRNSHVSPIDGVLFGFLRWSGAFYAVLALGAIVYIIRLRQQIVYGILEAVAACVVLWFRLPPDSPDLVDTVTTVGACVFLLFRGLDTIRFAIRDLGPWKPGPARPERTSEPPDPVNMANRLRMAGHSANVNDRPGRR